jgi:hypothetical protein
MEAPAETHYDLAKQALEAGRDVFVEKPPALTYEQGAHLVLILYDQRVELQAGQPVPIKGKGEEVAFDLTEPLRLGCQAFLDVITSRQSPLTDGKSGLRDSASCKLRSAHW